ncbi:hypothetical protein K458DRAFT_392251 [Lentithecium fluviatile CBS 122367]|uniref:Uncharacterized protein n=1 Tax=Lentithecium fluviatile CBS 122367 TaxID=1168545 RepID=A0A6G1IRY6_9PLEO|nr:hypothetical protein K458DRAFT_392251 [Lentithecium fluviatile CBS 122367]
MLRPLVDIDANSRQPGVKPSQLPAKTRSPVAPPSKGSEHRRSPFRVSASGSPRYLTHTPSPMAGLSPTAGSKIPRKAGHPTLPRRSQVGVSAVSQRVVVSKSRTGPKAAVGGPSAIPKPGHSPPANRDKPLPSPPIAQYVNPSSPPKAQRTLVDAEVAGTPTSEEWPILSPENVPSQKSSPLSAASSVYSDDGTLESDQRRDDAVSSNVDRPATAPAGASYPSKASAAPDSSTNCASLAGAEWTQTCSSNDLGSSPATVHAITTPHDEALDSPLSRKLPIPPRISSKRTSLPLPNKGYQPSVVMAALAATSRRHSKPGSTKWPMLEAKKDKEFRSAKAPLIPKRETELDVEDTGSDATTNINIHGISDSADASHFAGTQQTLPDSTSTSSVAAGSSLENQSFQDVESGNRVKRLSGRFTRSGLGPVLRIANDADSVLLGEGLSTSSVPPVPDVDASKSPQERSLSALAGRISRQTMSRMSISIGSRSSTPQLVENEMSVNSTIKIHPIRSMQPPRKASIESQPRSTSSPTRLPSHPVDENSKPPLPPSGNKRDSIATFQVNLPQETDVVELESSQGKDSPTLTQDADKDVNPNPEARPSKEITSKANHMLGINANRRHPSPRKPSAIPKSSPSHGLHKAKKTSPDRGKTGPPLIRSAHRNSRIVATRDCSVGSRSSPASRTARYCGENSPGSNMTGSGKSTTARPRVTTPELREPSMSAGNMAPMHSKSNTELSPKRADSRDSRCQDDGNAKETAAKVKAKRSFRDFFHIRDGKRTEKVLKPAENKRSSLTVTGNTLAKRFRNSANLSKPNLSKTSEPEGPPRPESEASRIDAGVENLVGQGENSSGDKENASEHATPEAPPATCSDTAVIINNIVNHVSTLPSDSADRLRGLEIAEVCKTIHIRSIMLKELVLTVQIKQSLLNSVDAYKQARISATKCRKHARQSELHAERAGFELKRMFKLCEQDFDHETVQAIKELIKLAGRLSPTLVRDRFIVHYGTMPSHWHTQSTKSLALDDWPMQADKSVILM